jgi:hypothetical protein
MSRWLGKNQRTKLLCTIVQHRAKRFAALPANLPIDGGDAYAKRKPASQGAGREEAGSFYLNSPTE